MPSIKCAHCKQTHTSVDEVKACAGIVPDADPFETLRQRGGLAEDDYVFTPPRQWTNSGSRLSDARPPVTVDQSTSGTHVVVHSQPATRPQRVTQVELPKGRYALAGRDGVVRFYLVDHGSPKGRWAGWVFVSGLVGAPGAWRKITLARQERDQITRSLAADVQGALKLFGYKAGCCGLCASPLSKATSRAAGYGADCARNHGLWYPSETEALRILDELEKTGAAL